MRTLRKLTKNKKGIDTILAALLMVVIVVVASVMVYAWSTGLLSSLLVKPSTGSEVVNVDSYTFTNTTSVTLYVRNTGSVSVSFVTYYVKDSASDTYTLNPWSGPTIAPGAVGTAVIGIGSTSGATLSGNAYTFTSGTWTVTLITAKGTQFNPPVTK